MLPILQPLPSYDAAQTVVSAYLLLFLAAFGAATVLPLPSEVPFAFVVRQSGERGWPVLVATAGNYLGACTTYLLARLAVARLRHAETGRWARATDTIRRFGAPALLLSWVPLLGDALVAVAGASRIPFVRFSLYTAAGKAARYGAIAWAISR
jgi:membrane protein YqaA with SNARE-associated domain